MSSSHSAETNKADSLPILMVNNNEDNTTNNLKLYIKNLQKVLLDPRVINNRIMVISIYGPQRTGKSFLMNYCIRYLRKKRIESLISNQEALNGFSWGPTSKSLSSGIYIWSEPYFTETINKNKVAVVLLDCQGSMDNKASIKEIIAIQAFCNLLSSLQIYNLFYQMTENNLQWAALTCDYANQFQSKRDDESETKSGTQGQSMCLLIRDWSYSYEYFYGAAGGQQYINRLMSIQQPKLPQENRKIRQFLNSQFKDINCFLMPHPGLNATMTDSFVGKWDSLSDDFQDQLHNLMKNLFAPNNIIAKEIADNFVTGRQMLTVAEKYFMGIMSLENPKPSTTFNGSANSHHYKIMNECLEFYTDRMKNRHLYIKTANILLGFHERCKMNTLKKYDKEIKFGQNIFGEIFREKLQSQIDEYFLRFYAFYPVEPDTITGMLSVIIITVIFLSVVGAVKMGLQLSNISLYLDEIDTFIFTSVLILIIYCVCSFKKFYNRLNISTEMQEAMRNQFSS